MTGRRHAEAEASCRGGKPLGNNNMALGVIAGVLMTMVTMNHEAGDRGDRGGVLVKDLGDGGNWEE
jgi:hypothetical protein